MLNLVSIPLRIRGEGEAHYCSSHRQTTGLSLWPGIVPLTRRRRRGRDRGRDCLPIPPRILLGRAQRRGALGRRHSLWPAHLHGREGLNGLFVGRIHPEMHRAARGGYGEAVRSCGLSRRAGPYDVGGDDGGGAFIVTASRDWTIKMWGLPGLVALDWCAAAKGVKPINLRARFSARAHKKVSFTRPTRFCSTLYQYP